MTEKQQPELPMTGSKDEKPSSQPQASPAPKQDAIVPAQPTAPEEPANGTLSVFGSSDNFAHGQRMAKALAASTLMPAAFQGNIPNTLIALELASRIGASALMVAQNLDIIHGRPSFRATFLIATINGSGRFSPLRYEFTDADPSSDDWGCRAVARDLKTGERCVGPLVTIGTAKAEKWFSKSGSKWQTLPELMLHYRSAAFWCRVYAPELSLGMQTREEVIDTFGEVMPIAPRVQSAPTTSSLEDALRNGGNGQRPHVPDASFEDGYGSPDGDMQPEF